MSEPYWTPLGGQPVDYEGAWNSGYQYAPGDVVVYNGVNYLAVNPSLNVVPPANLAIPSLGTSLPTTPFDGMEFILVDSLTAPTYAWRFRYTSSISDANKWVCIGGSALYAEVVAEELCSSTSYVDLTTVGPQITVPRAGIYQLNFSALTYITAAAAGQGYYSPKLGAAATSDANAVSTNMRMGATNAYDQSRRINATLAASALVKMQYKVGAGGQQQYFSYRRLEVTPVRVA